MIGIVEVFVLLLLNEVILKICMGNEKSVLKVNLILLVIVLVYELAVTGNGDLTRL